MEFPNLRLNKQFDSAVKDHTFPGFFFFWGGGGHLTTEITMCANTEGSII
jgi:hypothetical protein